MRHFIFGVICYRSFDIFICRILSWRARDCSSHGIFPWCLTNLAYQAKSILAIWPTVLGIGYLSIVVDLRFPLYLYGTDCKSFPVKIQIHLTHFEVFINFDSFKRIWMRRIHPNHASHFISSQEHYIEHSIFNRYFLPW